MTAIRSTGADLGQTAVPTESEPSNDDDYRPAAYDPSPTIGELTAGLWRTLTATPMRAAVSTVAAAATVVGVLALQPVIVRATDTHGPFVAHCGLGYYLFGHPNPAVNQVCMSSYAGRASVLLISTLVLAAAVTGLFAMCQVASGAPSRAVRVIATWVATPGRAALAALAGSALVVAAAALRTVPVHSRDSLGPFTAHCGISLYLFGNKSHVVQMACHNAFAGHARILITASCVFGVAVASGAALLVVARRQAHPVEGTTEMASAPVQEDGPNGPPSSGAPPVADDTLEILLPASVGTRRARAVKERTEA